MTSSSSSFLRSYVEFNQQSFEHLIAWVVETPSCYINVKRSHDQADFVLKTSLPSKTLISYPISIVATMTHKQL